MTDTTSSTITPHIDFVSDAALSDVLAGETAVLIWFTATWCGPCQELAPDLDELAAQHRDRVRVVGVDIDEEPAVMDRYGIASVPSFALHHRGSRVWQGHLWSEALPDVLSLVDRAAALDGVEDRGPWPPPPRPVRTVRVPELGPTYTVSISDRLNGGGAAQECGPGEVVVPEGHWLCVAAAADYRREPALDLTALNGFEAGAVDQFIIEHELLDLQDLSIPGLAEVASFTWAGPRRVSPAELAAVFPRLAFFQGALTGPADLNVHGSWTLPELATVVGGGEEILDPLVVPGSRPVTASDDVSALLGGTTLWFFARDRFGQHPEAQELASAVAEFAADRPDVPVRYVSLDTDDGVGTPFNLHWELFTAPALLVMSEDRQIARSGQVAGAAGFAAFIERALAAAERPDAGLALLEPRPARTLQVPSEQSGISIWLRPPGLREEAAMQAAPGEVQVPAGWQVFARLILTPEAGSADALAALRASGSEDIDKLVVFNHTDDTTALVESLPTGLRDLLLILDSDRLDDRGIAALQRLPQLRTLWLEERAGPEDNPVLDVLRARLPDVVVNEEWKAGGLR